MLLALKMEKGPMSHIIGGLKKLEKPRNRFFSRAPIRNAALPNPDFRTSDLLDCSVIHLCSLKSLSL